MTYISEIAYTYFKFESGIPPPLAQTNIAYNPACLQLFIKQQSNYSKSQ